MNKKYGIEAVQPLHFTLRFYAQIRLSPLSTLFQTFPGLIWYTGLCRTEYIPTEYCWPVLAFPSAVPQTGVMFAKMRAALALGALALLGTLCLVEAGVDRALLEECDDECFYNLLYDLPIKHLMHLSNFLKTKNAFLEAQGTPSSLLELKDGSPIGTAEQLADFDPVKNDVTMKNEHERMSGKAGGHAVGDVYSQNTAEGPSSVLSRGNSYTKQFTGHDPSVLFKPLAQPALEGFYPAMGYEEMQPGCHAMLAKYFAGCAGEMLPDKPSFKHFLMAFSKKKEELRTVGKRSTVDRGLRKTLDYADRLLVGGQ